MKIGTLLEVISAAHLAQFVDVSEKMSVRGGLMLVAPPASLKSTVIKQLEVFPNALVLSDMNVRQIMQIREDVANGIYSTVALTELRKIYQRQDTTSSNVEGHLAAMTDEGFKHTSNEDQRMVTREAKCLVVAAMTQELYRKRYPEWLDSGFARRFVWCHYILEDRLAIVKAIHEWKPLEIAKDMVIFGLPKGTVPYTLSAAESATLIKYLRFYKDIETPLILLKKIACVLKWRYKDVDAKKAMMILEDFSACLTKRGAELSLK